MDPSDNYFLAKHFHLYAIFNCLLGERKFEFVLEYEHNQIGKYKIKATKICD